MKKSLITLVFLTLLIALCGNGISLNSIGPKAGAMGGAFIGQADDATAVYWNPAGLVGQKATFSVSMVDPYLFPSYKYDALGIDTKVDDVHFPSPHMFANYSKDKFAWGFGLFVPHGLGVEWDGGDLLALNGPQTVEVAPGMILNNNSYGKEFNWSAEISMITVSSSAAYQVTDKFNVGFTVNIHHGSMSLERGENRVNNFSNALSPDEQGMLDTQYEEDVNGSGTSFGFGLQYTPIDDLTIGLTYRSPSVVALTGDWSLWSNSVC
jgi:long-chain fatty acid transport protein